MIMSFFFGVSQKGKITKNQNDDVKNMFQVSSFALLTFVLYWSINPCDLFFVDGKKAKNKQVKKCVSKKQVSLEKWMVMWWWLKKKKQHKNMENFFL